MESGDLCVIKPVKEATGQFCPGGGASVGANFTGGVTPKGLRFIENVDYRIPSNDPSQGAAVDPDIKPYREHESVFGAAYQINRDWAFESRYTRRPLHTLIEDSRYLGPNGHDS